MLASALIIPAIAIGVFRTGCGSKSSSGKRGANRPQLHLIACIASCGYMCTLQGKPCESQFPTEMLRQHCNQKRFSANDASQFFPVSQHLIVDHKWSGISTLQSNTECVRIIDDEPTVRTYISTLVSLNGFLTRGFSSAEQFMSEDKPSEPGCVVVDLNLPGSNGAQLLEWIGKQPHVIPAIVVTGTATVPAAVQCLKHGAIDFLEKPVNSELLLASIRRAVAVDTEQRSEALRLEDCKRDYATLTDREKEVLALLSQGLLSKQIAGRLHLSVRTVEKHRIGVMKKMRADSVAEVVRMPVKLGL